MVKMWITGDHKTLCGQSFSNCGAFRRLIYNTQSCWERLCKPHPVIIPKIHHVDGWRVAQSAQQLFIYRVEGSARTR